MFNIFYAFSITVENVAKLFVTNVVPKNPQFLLWGMNTKYGCVTIAFPPSQMKSKK